MTQTIDKVAWTLVRDRRVLFARSRGQELFYCVGGKRKKGESDLVALIREVKEETGGLIVGGSAMHIHTFEGPCHGYQEGTLLKMTCYEAEFMGHLSASCEVEELGWFTTSDMHRTTELGQEILRWLNKKGFID